MGSPKHGTSPVSSNQQRRKDDERELDRHGKDYSHRHSDRYSSRSFSGCSSRYDEHSRRERRLDDEERRRESRDTRDEGEHGRSREYMRNADRYSRDKYGGSGYRCKDKERELLSRDGQRARDRDVSPDRTEEKDRDWHRRDRDGRDEKRELHRGFGNHKSGRALHFDESKGYRNDTSGRENEGHRHRDSYKNDQKELSGLKDRQRHDDWDNNKDTDRYDRAPQERSGDKPVVRSENQESLSKRTKFSSEPDVDHSRDANDRQKQVQETDVKITADQVYAKNAEGASDLNAAKVAAMKAAELVNRNLVGVGVMSTEQKKKLLWGNKKSTTSEVSSRRWDTAIFDDHERQEKFNKLMSEVALVPVATCRV